MTTLYEKRGRRYHPWGDYVDRHWDLDRMQVGEARLTVCTEPGARRHTYDVTLDTAGFVAAAQVAAQAMVDAIQEKARAAPQLDAAPYTARQQRLIEQFRHDMAEAGALVPVYWTHASALEIAQAGIDAVARLEETGSPDPRG